MGLFNPLPLDRVYLINPGQTLDIGDRTLTAVKPPTFDNPITTGFLDGSSGAFFSADCFGAVLPDVPAAASDIEPNVLRECQVLWTTVDSAWIHKVDQARLATELDAIRDLKPSAIFSSHLPPASGGMTEQLIESVAAAPGAQPFAGPDQAALAQMLSEMTGPS
jgi:flavorubredoxin